MLSTVTDDSTRGTARVGVSLASAPPSATKPTKRETPLTQKLPPLKVQPGDVIRPAGRTGARQGLDRPGRPGLALGPLTGVEAPVTEPVKGTVTASVANLPNRTSDGGFASSLGTLTAGARTS